MSSKQPKVVNIHEAKTHLSRLIEEAVNGKPFVIAKAGKPMVKVVALVDGEVASPLFGFMKGRIVMPDDFDTFGAEEIQEMFEDLQ